MKPSFSIGDSLGSSFALIRRRPLAVFVWGFLMISVVAAIYSLIFPMLLSMPPDQGEAAMDTFTSDVMAVQLASNGLSIVMYLVLLVVFTAAGRAALAPGRSDRFLFLRLGMDEVRVAVTVVAIFLAWYIALVVLVLIGVALAFALWSVSEFWTVVGLLIYGLVVCLLALFGWARVSLIAPASLILGRFAFSEGWAIARGQVLKLVGLNLLIWLIYMVCYLLVLAVVAAILIGGFIGQGLSWPQDVQSPQDLMPVVQPMLIPLLATVPIFAFGYGAYIALIAAPFVRAARQLLDGVPVRQDTAPTDTLQTI